MFGKPSIWTRIAVGKMVGFVIGLMAFIAIGYLMPTVTWMERWGFLFWYTTVGAVVGMFGVVNYHPILKMPMPWWFRAPFLGAWMNFVLTLFAYDLLGDAMTAIFGEGGGLQSPWWFVAEGAVVGTVIGFFATKFGGEGPETTNIQG